MHLSEVARRHLALAIPSAAVLALGVWVLLYAPGDVLQPLTGVLALTALVANLAPTSWSRRFVVDGSFIPWMLAAAFLGPGPAFVVAVSSELGVWLYERYRLRALPVNLLAGGGPSVLAAMLLEQLAPATGAGLAFFFALAVCASLALALNALIVASLIPGTYGETFIPQLRPFLGFAPALVITVGMTVATAAIYATAGMAGALFVFFGILAFTYMARLVVTARDRASQHAALSWGGALRAGAVAGSAGFARVASCGGGGGLRA